MKNHRTKKGKWKNKILNFYYLRVQEYLSAFGCKTLTFSYAILVFFTSPPEIRNSLYDGIACIYSWSMEAGAINQHTVLVSLSCIGVILFTMWLIDRSFYYFLISMNLKEPSFLQITQPVTILTQQKHREKLEEVVARVKHHALHDHPVIEPSLSNITTYYESKLIFRYLGFTNYLCLKKDFIREFLSKKTLLKMEDKSFRKQLHYQNKRLIFYRKIMYCSIVFIFFTFGYNIYKVQKKPEIQSTTFSQTKNETKNETKNGAKYEEKHEEKYEIKQESKPKYAEQNQSLQLSIYYVYLLYILLFIIGYRGYEKQNQNINFLTFRALLESYNNLPKVKRPLP